MKKPTKEELLERIIEGTQDAGWNIILLQQTHPFLVHIFNGVDAYRVRIYVWNLTHGGGAQRPSDEYRVQITGIDNAAGFSDVDVDKVVILGWWQEAGVFAGFDFNAHRGALGASASIQIREEALRRAAINGLATHNKGNAEIAVALRPVFFPAYIRDLEKLHGLGASEEDRKLLEDVIEDPDVINSARLRGVAAERKVVMTSIARTVRDESFRDRVLSAYRSRCAFCDVQLKLVEAAHIVPVAESGTDATENGIALCVLHHRAFDRALVTLNEEYQVILNETKLKELAQLGLDGGADLFKGQLRAVIQVPAARADRPNAWLIRQANRLRGWNF